MGGSNDRSNLVQLTPEEHYVAHQLLHKIHPKVPGLIFALIKMTGNPHGQRNNKLYGWIRRKSGKETSIRNIELWKNPEFKANHKIIMDRVRSDPEYGAKLSRSQKGKVMSAQAKLNIAEGGRNRKPRVFSDEAKANMAKARRKTWEERKLSGEDIVIAAKTKATRIANGSYVFTEEHKTNISKGGIGKILTESHKEKLSNALKGKPKTKEHIEKVANANRGAKRGPLSDEHKQKLRESSTGRKHSKESLEKMSKSQKGILPSQATRELWSKQRKGKIHSEDQKVKIAEGLKKAYANGRKGALSKLTDDQVREIRQLLCDKSNMQKDIARNFGVSQAAISEIKHGKSYLNVI